MTDEPRSVPILAQARADAYREGWSQAAQCGYDDAFERGRQQGEAANSRDNRLFRWLCFIAGAGLGYFISWSVS